MYFTLIFFSQKMSYTVAYVFATGTVLVLEELCINFNMTFFHLIAELNERHFLLLYSCYASGPQRGTAWLLHSKL